MTVDATTTFDREALLDEVVTAYLKEARAGKTPDAAAWQARYPELAADLAEFFADRAALERLAGPLRTVAVAIRWGRNGLRFLVSADGALSRCSRAAFSTFRPTFLPNHCNATPIAYPNVACLNFTAAASFDFADDEARVARNQTLLPAIDHAGDGQPPYLGVLKQPLLGEDDVLMIGHLEVDRKASHAIGPFACHVAPLVPVLSPRPVPVACYAKNDCASRQGAGSDFRSLQDFASLNSGPPFASRLAGVTIRIQPPA
jgi:hypothetical protein